jgi:YD repeat-containing protein
MQDQVLRDRNGRMIGTIRAGINGRLTASNKDGRLVGSFDPSTNTTSNASGRVVGQGNLLSALVVQASQ